MKRLLKISLDTLLSSIMPVLIWFILGMLLDKNLINVFSLTYPIQFIGGLIISVFSTGSNISAQKNKDKNEVFSSMLIGICVSLIVLLLLLLNVENYISFMNMDINIYKYFTIYAIVQMFLRLIIMFVLNKLYYEENNDLANCYSIIFNFINLILITLVALFTKNHFIIISSTLSGMIIYTIYVLIKNIPSFKFKINLSNWIKYDSVEMINTASFFVIYLFGFSNVFEFGIGYVTAIAFTNLITDAQWDVFDAISTVAKIDVSKNCFDYKTHIRNAYKLCGLIAISTLIMFGGLFWFYNLSIWIVLAFLSIEIFCWLIYPIYKIKTCYLQIDYSAKKLSINKIVSNILRTICSFLKTPFCTGIGQVASALYQLITINIIYKKVIINTEKKNN